jgi:hypothetical protein
MRSGHFVIGKIHVGQAIDDGLVNGFFPHGRGRAYRWILEGPIVTAVIDMALFPFRYERIATRSARRDSAELKHVPIDAVYLLAGEKRLDRLEYVGGHERLMIAGERLAGLANPYQADVKRVLEHLG